MVFIVQDKGATLAMLEFFDNLRLRNHLIHRCVLCMYMETVYHLFMYSHLQNSVQNIQVNFFFPHRTQQLPHHGSTVSQQHSPGTGLHSAEDSIAVGTLLQPRQSIWAKCWPSSQKCYPATGRVSGYSRLVNTL